MERKLMESPYLDFEKEPAKSALKEWWKKLKDNRGDRAELRRVQKPSQAVFVSSFHQLLYALRKENIKVSDNKLALVACLAAKIKDNMPGQKIGHQMGAPKPGSKNSAIGCLRFRRLLEIEIRDEQFEEDFENLYRQWSRIISALGFSANVIDLANTVYRWNWRNVKKKLAYAYYEKAPENKGS